MINVVGIVFDSRTEKILIGKREDDPYLKELTWCFPGGRPRYGEPLEQGLKREIKKKTGIDVEIKKMVFARAIEEREEFLVIYYFCKPAGGELKAGEKFTEVKWVRPTEVKRYFRTSIHPRVMGFLQKLEF